MPILILTREQTGDGARRKTKSGRYFLCLLMIHEHPFPYIDLWNTVPWPVVNIQVNGLDLRQLQNAFSKSVLPGQSCSANRDCRALSEQHLETGLKVYVNGDGADVYEDTYRRIAVNKDGNTSATLILVGIRLGIDRVTPVYWDSLKAALRLPQSMGIAG